MQSLMKSIHPRVTRRSGSRWTSHRPPTIVAKDDTTSSTTVVVTTTTPTTPTTNRRFIPSDGKTLRDFVSSSSSLSSSTPLPSSSSSKNIQQQPPPKALFHIKTYGCQMNVNDTDIVRAILLDHGGYQEAPTEDEATIWLTNTCAIREKAEQKVWQRLQTQKKNATRTTRTGKTQSSSSLSSSSSSKVVVGVLGCMAERLQERLLEEKVADLVVGPDAYRDLPRLLDQLLAASSSSSSSLTTSSSTTSSSDESEEHDHHHNHHHHDNLTVPSLSSSPSSSLVSSPTASSWTAMNVQLSFDETYSDIVPVRSSTEQQPFSAFVSIQRGCSNRCSFCIVPFTRGQERSRPLESIVAEVTQLLERDHLKEVVLLGQNVNSYHDRSDSALAARPFSTVPSLSNEGFRSRINKRHFEGGYSFVDLVETIANLSPELRVRFTSPHPKDYPTELLHCMAERSNVCNQLHMPAQSGSTTMLKRMKRGYSRDAYLELIHTVQSMIPDVALSSDFIAGFCGETDEEHADTVSLLEQVQYEQAFLFAYSMREKTHAHKVMEDNVPASIKQARLQELIDTFRTNVHAKNERVEVGKLRLVLVEGPSKRQPPPPLSFTATTDHPHNRVVTWHGRTDQNKRILFPVQLQSSSETTASVFDESFANHQAAVAATMTTSMSSVSSTSGGNNNNNIIRINHANSNSVVLRPPPSSSSMASLSPGDYAVVQVTEAKGHTLRGQVLWKTTLANFSKFETDQLSNLHAEQLEGFKKQLRVLLSP